jgi:hypothetical protein
MYFKLRIALNKTMEGEFHKDLNESRPDIFHRTNYMSQSENVEYCWKEYDGSR